MGRGPNSKSCIGPPGWDDPLLPLFSAFPPHFGKCSEDESAANILISLEVVVLPVNWNWWWAMLVKNTLSGRVPLLLPCSKPWFLSRSLLVLCCQGGSRGSFKCKYCSRTSCFESSNIF